MASHGYNNSRSKYSLDGACCVGSIFLSSEARHNAVESVGIKEKVSVLPCLENAFTVMPEKG